MMPLNLRIRSYKTIAIIFIASLAINVLAIKSTYGTLNDIPIGESSPKLLQSSDGNDFLFGGSTQQRSNPGDPNANPPFPFVPSNDPITPDPTTGAQVQIFIIFTGPSGVDTSDLEGIANTTGGDFFRVSTDEEWANILLKIMNLPPGSMNTPPQR
ncbi:hypothetical protein [Microcoleus sp. PH2017_28_MFU_U_A]|jgi:hypothetical protein|uniref:hypothetical protein n=2 Tax=unclassified Microcoleus TaxID=2642155 RepID=UPI001DA84050|nr:hypothetical protein [Microcoleus sp. PH2017_28_MFU_U_A]MCC3593994.1 hypothetical protein [Microcoleus sp. PH2017_28_MFU_U_A]TAE71078.1 MAG: hypothetical protein EAZ86_03480 [Oscillatoriales cyanobacterium]